MWPASFVAELKPEYEQKETMRSAEKDQKVLTGIEIQSAVVTAGGEFWASIQKWGSDRSLLTPTEKGVLLRSPHGYQNSCQARNKVKSPLTHCVGSIARDVSFGSELIDKVGASGRLAPSPCEPTKYSLHPR